MNAYDEALAESLTIGMHPADAARLAGEYAAYAAKCDARRFPSQKPYPVAGVDFSDAARCARDEHDFIRSGDSFACEHCKATL